MLAAVHCENGSGRQLRAGDALTARDARGQADVKNREAPAHCVGCGSPRIALCARVGGVGFVRSDQRHDCRGGGYSGVCGRYGGGRHAADQVPRVGAELAGRREIPRLRNLAGDGPDLAGFVPSRIQRTGVDPACRKPTTPRCGGWHVEAGQRAVHVAIVGVTLSLLQASLAQRIHYFTIYTTCYFTARAGGVVN